MIEPKIEGRITPEMAIEKRQSKSKLMVQVDHMDIIPPKPIDEVPYTRDFTTMKDQTEKIKRAKEFMPTRCTERQRATLERARAAKAAYKRWTNLQGNAAAQGGPAEPMLVDLVKEMRQRFDKVDKELDDMKKIQAEEQPLQPQGIVKPSKERVTVVPSQLNQLKVYTPGDGNVAIPLTSNHHQEQVIPREVDQLGQSAKYAQKVMPAMQTYNFYTDEVRARALQDYTMGQRPTVSQQPPPIIWN